MRTIAAAVLVLLMTHGASAAEYLVWTAVEGGGWKTDWLRVDGEHSEVLATRSDLALTDGSTLWVGQPVEVEAHTCPCDEPPPGDTVICPRAPAGHAFDLLDLVSGSSVTVVEPAGVDVIGERQQSVEFLGAVGPYLFVGGSVYEYACGAHGGATNSFVVWNMARREVSAIVSEDELAAAGVKERVKAWGVLRHAEGVDDAESPEALEWTMALPRYVDGRLQLQYQYTVWVPFAFSDGLWHSYSRSTRVPVAVLPRSLQPYTEPPPVVEAYVQTLKIDTERPMPYGFGAIHVNDVQRETLLQRFGEGISKQKQSGPRQAADPSGSYRGKVGDLPSCTVSADKSFFHEDPAASTIRKAYVISGDRVEILPAPFDAEEPFVYARFVGKRVTSGYLRTDTLTCD